METNVKVLIGVLVFLIILYIIDRIRTTNKKSTGSADSSPTTVDVFLKDYKEKMKIIEDESEKRLSKLVKSNDGTRKKVLSVDVKMALNNKSGKSLEQIKAEEEMMKQLKNEGKIF